MLNLSLVADNGEQVYATELGLMEQIVFAMMGYDVDTYVVYVFKPDNGDETDEEFQSHTLEEAAPLHQEFFGTELPALKRANIVLDQINEGTFKYVPPILPVTDEF